MDKANSKLENQSLRKIQGKLLQWESKLAPLSQAQIDAICSINLGGAAVDEKVNKSEFDEVAFLNQLNLALLF